MHDHIGWRSHITVAADGSGIEKSDSFMHHIAIQMRMPEAEYIALVSTGKSGKGIIIDISA